MDENETILEFLNLLKEKEIKLVAIDFDNTFISIHTSGMWAGSVEQLARYARPTFVKLINNILANTPVMVAIVTFSTQTELVAKVLKQVLSNPSGIYVQPTTKELLSLKKKLPGKEGHISLVLRNIYRNHGIKIANEEILLIDDDEENIDAALKNNHFAYCFKEETTMKSFNEYLASLGASSNLSLVVNYSSELNNDQNANNNWNPFKPSLNAVKFQDSNTNNNSKVYIKVPFLYLPVDPRTDRPSNYTNFLNANSAFKGNAVGPSIISNKHSFCNNNCNISPSAVVYISNNVTHR